MKRVVVLLLLAIISVIAIMGQKVAIFDPDGNLDAFNKGIVREEISSVIVNDARGYTVVERAQIDKVMREQGVQLGGLVDESTMVEVGKIAGAEFVFVSVIQRSSTNNNFHISCKLINVQTAVVVMHRVADSQSGTNELRSTIRKMVCEMFGARCGDTRVVGSLVADKRNVYADGKKLSNGEVKRVMANTDALRLYKKGVSKNRSGCFWLLAGLGATTAGVVFIANDTFGEHEVIGTGSLPPGSGDAVGDINENLSLVAGGATAAAGVVMMLSGASMRGKSKRLIQNSVNTYNSGRTSNIEWQFDFTGSGVRFALSF